METFSSQLIGCLLAETANAKWNVTLRLLSLTVWLLFKPERSHFTLVFMWFSDEIFFHVVIEKQTSFLPICYVFNNKEMEEISCQSDSWSMLTLCSCILDMDYVIAMFMYYCLCVLFFLFAFFFSRSQQQGSFSAPCPPILLFPPISSIPRYEKQV